MDTSANNDVMVSADSTATLDLQDLLSSLSGENLLSTSLSVLSASGSTHSFDDVPPFPATSKPSIFVPELGDSLLRPKAAGSNFPISDDRLRTTVPTAPRLKLMMLEPASVAGWIASVPSALGPPCAQDEKLMDMDAAQSLLWIAEGSMFSPQEFSALRRQHASITASESSSSTSPSDWDASDCSGDLTLISIEASVSSISCSISENENLCIKVQEKDASVQLLVPTIMVSSSTAVLPVSLESSQNLSRELPLAVRRGKKPPPALSLGQPSKADHDKSRDSYPDIPTPFLGSPTTCTPTIDVSSTAPTSEISLSAMCADLRSRLPPPPFTPTEAAAPPLTDTSVGNCDLVESSRFSVSSDLDDEEWAFAKDLVIGWRAGKGFRMELSPPPSPAGELPYTSEPDSPTIDAPFAEMPVATEAEVPTPAQTNVKLSRRKTVIIQAPEPSLEKTEKMEKTRSIVAGSEADMLSTDFHDPVPFETPGLASSAPAAVVADCDCQPPRDLPTSRPSSTASMKPMRGILKEKKSVRFSTVDLLHEYSSSTQSPPAHHRVDAGATANRRSSPSVQPGPEPSVRAQRITLTAAVHKNSPLRESYSPASHRPSELADHRPLSQNSATGESHRSSLFPARTMAKHPAVRALARTSSSPISNTSTPLRMAGSGIDGAVVGAPGLQPPTPLLLQEQRRAPLRSINAQQSMPVERRPDALIPVKATRRSLLSNSKDKAGGNVPTSPITKRALRTASIPAAPRQEQDENVRRRSQAVHREGSYGVPTPTGSAGKSRMSAPLRSILTKLRT
ncbi:hypothetical protein GY45DRAFT_1323067 [Cubamyces sp. BRFM 1775]|nr:hypothetical protein GY45DRAFT_1323067 [Cubamyces sp. BRFM 1775]